MLLCALLLGLSSCGGKSELKEAAAVIKSMTDSTVVAIVDGDDATLVTTEVRIVNGMYMPGDSVRLYYVGRLSSGEARAMLIALIPQRSQTISIGVDTSRELMTIEPEEKQEHPAPADEQ